MTEDEIQAHLDKQPVTRDPYDTIPMGWDGDDIEMHINFIRAHATRLLGHVKRGNLGSAHDAGTAWNAIRILQQYVDERERVSEEEFNRAMKRNVA